MRTPPTDLIALVADVFDIEPSALTSRSQKRHIFEARAVAAWLLRQCYETMGLVEIGELLGGRDHTTIISALRRVEEWRAANADYRALLDDLRERYKPMRPRGTGARIRVQIRHERQHGGAWWAAQSMPWQPPTA